MERLVRQGQGHERPPTRPLLTDPGRPDRAARRDARASGLRYVSVDAVGISRQRAGRGFTYRSPSGRTLRGKDTLARIKALAIPPAWTEVWICPEPEGHIQALGRDAAGRRQYRYHPAFRARRDAGKFERLIRFGERLPRIRRQTRRDLARRGLPREKVLAAVVSLLELTRLRVGNEEYVGLNRSFGLSTLRDRHAVVRGASIRFRFRGKGGRTEEREVFDRRLATIVRRCQELPGQELFQYEDEAGEVRSIGSEDVNDYIREAGGDASFSAKDFRTWTATVHAFRELRRAPIDDPAEGRGNPVIAALRRTAEKLGNTLAVTRSAYVHPAVVAAFEEGDIERVRSRGPASAEAPPNRADELELLKVLRRASRDARRSKPARRESTTRSRRPAD